MKKLATLTLCALLSTAVGFAQQEKSPLQYMIERNERAEIPMAKLKDYQEEFLDFYNKETRSYGTITYKILTFAIADKELSFIHTGILPLVRSDSYAIKYLRFKKGDDIHSNHILELFDPSGDMKLYTNPEIKGIEGFLIEINKIDK